MQNQIKLGARLKAAADFVKSGLPTADIGTDHAYLPVYLVSSGILDSAFASDINEGPLENARQTAIKYNLQDKITLRLSDGLMAYKEDEIKQIIICGMGGELIAKILSDWAHTQSEGMRLILQPMSKPEVLRQYLAESGFKITEEKGAFDDGRYYTVICAEYSGEPIECDELYLAIGGLKAVKTHESEGYKRMCLRRLDKKIVGIASQNPDSEEIKSLKKLREEIEKTI